MFGDNLKEARLKKLISQEELAAMVGVDQTMIAKIEKNTKLPGVILAVNIEKAVGVPVRELLEGKKAV